MVGDRLLLSPLGELATVKAINVHEAARAYASVGDNVDIGLILLGPVCMLRFLQYEHHLTLNICFFYCNAFSDCE